MPMYGKVNLAAAQAAAAAAAASAASVAALAGTIAGIEDNFDALTSVNLYDPNIASHADATVYQLNGSAAALATYHASGLLPVSVGQYLVIDQTNTAAEWSVYKPSGQLKIHGYAAAPATIGNLSTMITGVWSLSDRLVKIGPIPAGVNFIAFSSHHTGAPTADDYALMRRRTAVYVGVAQVDFPQFYAPYTYEPAPVQGEGAVLLEKSGTNAYIGQPFNATYATVRRDSWATPAVGVAGCVDFPGVRLVTYAALALLGPKDAYDAVPAGVLRLHSATDNSSNEKWNGVFLGGQHGIPSSYVCTLVGHGLTAANVGDKGPDSAAKQWQLARVIDANNVHICAWNTGAADKWSIVGALTGLTVTFAGAGAKTFSSAVSTQLYPVAQNHAVTVWLDGEQITADGIYAGERPEVRESYGVANLATWQTTLAAQLGTAAPLAPNDASLPTQLDYCYSWQYDRYGAEIPVEHHQVLTQYTRSGGGTDDHHGPMQRQLVGWQAGESLWFYAPDQVAAVSGYNLSATCDVTANAATVNVDKANALVPADPPGHIAQFVKDAGGNPRFSFAMGLAKHIGVGATPALRTRLFQLSPSEKMYSYGVDSAAGATAAAGESLCLVGWNGYHDMSANPTHTVNRLVQFANGRILWIFDVHATLTAEWVKPGGDLFGEDLVGLPVALIESTTLTLHTASAVMGKGMRVTTTGGRGRCMAWIG